MRAKNPLYNVNHKKTRIETRKHEKGKLMEKTGRLKRRHIRLRQKKKMFGGGKKITSKQHTLKLKNRLQNRNGKEGKRNDKKDQKYTRQRRKTSEA